MLRIQHRRWPVSPKIFFRDSPPGSDQLYETRFHHQPNGEWMVRVARNLTDAIDGFLLRATHMIHDRDSLFTRAFAQTLRTSGMEPVRLPPRSPNLNAYAERFVRSIREECLNRVVPLGDRHLHFLVREYANHYHRERNHQGLDNQLLERPPPCSRHSGEVLRRQRLGGLLNYYHREAA